MHGILTLDLKILWLSDAAKHYVFGESALGEPLDKFLETDTNSLKTSLTKHSKKKLEAYSKCGRLNADQVLELNLERTGKVLAMTLKLQSSTQVYGLTEAQCASLNQLLQTMRGFIVRTDLAGRYTFYNDAFLKQFGWLYNGEPLGKNSFKSISPHHHQRVQKAVTELLHGEKIVEVELDKPSGKKGYMRTAWNFSLLHDADGNPSEVQCVGIDLSEQIKTREELKLSEERFQQFAQNSGIVMWETNMDGLYTYVSPMSTKIWSFKPKELINKYHFYDLHPLKGREKLKIEGLKLIRSGRSFSGYENMVQRKDDEVVWMSSSGVPFFDGNGVQIGVRGGDVDISQQIIQNKAVEYQNKTLRQLAWIQSHELRAPLANIIGLVNLLKNEYNDQQINRETLLFLEREAERLDRTIRTIVEKAHQAETPPELRLKRRKKRPKTGP